MISEQIDGVEYRIYSELEWPSVMVALLSDGWRPQGIEDGRLAAGSKIVAEFERLRSHAVVVAKSVG